MRKIKMETLLTNNVTSRINKLYHSSKTNSIKKTLQFNITTDYLETLYIGCQGRCPFTGIKLDPVSGTIAERNPKGISIDRIDSSQGYVKGNVRLVSTWYNNAKAAGTDEFIVEMSKRLVNNLMHLEED
jgi:hypothetical protein|tara:strand:- start:432 stop:818 length:387 start_codon:yes stop_codon:yes gene_type:complete